MQKYIVWYQLLLKVHLKKKMYWIQLLAILALMIIIGNIHFPSNDNVSVGLYMNEGIYAQKIAAELMKENSLFHFTIYPTKEEFDEDVISSKIECGFVFNEGLDEKIKMGKLQKAITYVATPLTNKGEVVQETVYAALFRMYSDELLLQAQSEIYGNIEEQRNQRLLEQNQMFQQQKDILQIDMKTVATINGKQKNNHKTYPIQGMLGIFVFLIMFLTYGRKFEYHGNAVHKALSQREGFAYDCINTLAAGTIPAIIGISVSLISNQSRGIFIEFIAMIILWIWSSAWIGIVGKYLINTASFVSCIMVIVVLNFLLCPIFIDLSSYVPALQYVRCVFPVGLYLLFL